MPTPNADLPTILALHHFMIVADGTTDFSKGNGTGAFVLRRNSSRACARSGTQEQELLEISGKPNLEGFEFFAISDETARMNALLSGDIHLAAILNPRSLRAAREQPGSGFSSRNPRATTPTSMFAWTWHPATRGDFGRLQIPHQPRADQEIGAARTGRDRQ